MPEDQRRGRREEGGRGGVPHTPGVDQPPGERRREGGGSDGGRDGGREGWREVYTNHFIKFHGCMRYENVLVLLLGGGRNSS